MPGEQQLIQKKPATKQATLEMNQKDSTDLNSLFSDLNTLLIMTVLKHFSSSDKPLHSKAICDIILTLWDTDKKNIQRRLSGLRKVFPCWKPLLASPDQKDRIPMKIPSYTTSHCSFD